MSERDQETEDRYVLGKALETISDMIPEAERDAVNLESFRAAILRRPKSPMRDFAIQSLDRTIAKHVEWRGQINPCHRMLTQYLEKTDG